MSSGLYNGSEYIPLSSGIMGHPFFKEREEEGSILYDGRFYDNVKLLYDIARDQVLITHFDETGKYVPVKLIRSKIAYFNIDGHHFINHYNEDPERSIIESGIYDLIYDGDLKVLVKRSKDIQNSNNFYYNREFRLRTRIYLLKDGQYIRLRKKGSILRALSDRKKELKKFIREHQLPFNENRESSFKAICRHYDQLDK